jgi:hypothetical protein
MQNGDKQHNGGEKSNGKGLLRDDIIRKLCSKVAIIQRFVN